ncbi:MAG: DUF1631 family protein [Usitatibacter sp.]
MSQAILQEVRESLSRPFGDAMAARVPEVVDLLEQQLAITEDRGKWKPLRGAIDLLRSLQPTLAKRVAKEVAMRFDAKVDPSEGFSKTQRFTLDSLSLVADEQVQEEIALGNTTKRLKESLGDELFALTQRVANVMHRDDLGDDNNPVFPRIFARGLMDALSEKGSDDGSRLAAYSGFGPVVLEEVAAAYSSTNQLLRDKGVLPDFKRSYGSIVQAQAPRRTVAAPAPVPATSDAAIGTAASSPAPSPLDNLFALASGQPVARPAVAATAAPAPEGTVNINVRPELLEALKNLEPRLAALMAPSQGVAPRAAPVFPASSAAVHQAKQEMGGSLTPDDVVVADLVAALFDRLFADTRLTDTTRAQVGRLQLPVFKAVLQDRSFFTDRRHPIRGLIDAMAELGATDEAVTVDGKPPSRWIANSVNEILERHAEDSQVFAQSLQKLTQILERYREAALEQDDDIRMLRDKEVGLAAVREASLAIAHRLSGGNYAREVEAYLYGRFRQVMVHDFLSGGDNSPNWNADLEICDDILWVLTPHTTPEDRQRLVSLLPSLLFRLKMAYQRAGLSQDTAGILVEEVRQLLDEVMTSPVATAHGAIRKDPPPMPAEDYTATLRVSSGSLAEEGLTRGVWMEFTEDDGSKRRCRLNWMSPVQGTCVFKDLEKNRSFAISVDDLRDRRRNGKAVVVDGAGVAQSTIDGAIADVARNLGTPQ